MHLFKATIKSILLYGSDSWSLTINRIKPGYSPRCTILVSLHGIQVAIMSLHKEKMKSKKAKPKEMLQML